MRIWVLHDGIKNISRAIRHNEIPAASDALIAQFHLWSGIAIALLVVWRLYLRCPRGVPAAPANESAGLKFVHWPPMRCSMGCCFILA